MKAAAPMGGIEMQAADQPGCTPEAYEREFKQAVSLPPLG